MPVPMSRRRVLGAIVGVGGLGLAACTATASPTPAPASSPAPASPAAAATVGPRPASGQVFNLGFVPGEDAEEVLKRYKPLVEYLGTTMDVSIKGFVGTDYSATVEAMKARKLDAAFFGPFAYVLAAEVAGAKILAMRGNPDGTPGTYRSLIVANKRSGATTLSDLRGRSFAFVDPASTSGHLIPRSTLVKAGLDPDKDLKTTFAGGHDASLLAVNGAKVDAGAVSDSQFNRMVDQKLIDPTNVVIVATSEPIPSSPFATRGDLDPALRERLLTALLDLHTKLPADLVKALLGDAKNRYIVASDATFDPLRETAKVLKLDLTKMKE